MKSLALALVFLGINIANANEFKICQIKEAVSQTRDADSGDSYYSLVLTGSRNSDKAEGTVISEKKFYHTWWDAYMSGKEKDDKEYNDKKINADKKLLKIAARKCDQTFSQVSSFSDDTAEVVRIGGKTENWEILSVGPAIEPMNVSAVELKAESIIFNVYIKLSHIERSTAPVNADYEIVLNSGDDKVLFKDSISNVVEGTYRVSIPVAALNSYLLSNRSIDQILANRELLINVGFKGDSIKRSSPLDP